VSKLPEQKSRSWTNLHGETGSSNPRINRRYGTAAHGFFFPYSGPPHSVRRWLDERGMDASESSSEVISRAAVFDFYLKSTLHSLYVPEVEELEPLDVEADHAREFETARDLTGNEGFSPTPPGQLAAELPEDAQRQILSLRSAVHGYDQPATVLSSVYECLFTQKARRELGQFATPIESAALSRVGRLEDSATVLDPGVGAGMLSSAVVREKAKRGDNTYTGHQGHRHRRPVRLDGCSFAEVNRWSREPGPKYRGFPRPESIRVDQ